jgi:3-oxoadipate enol-lactonase
VPVGLSVGGMIVTRFASSHPRRVPRLVLCDTAHKIGSDELWNARIAAVEKDGLASIKDVVMERWFSPGFRSSQPAALSVCSNMLVRQPVAGYVGTCAALRDTDNTELVKALKMPVLLMVGSNDGSTPPDLVRSTHDLIPGSRFVVLDGPGHIPCVEAPEETARLISAFVSGH